MTGAFPLRLSSPPFWSFFPLFFLSFFLVRIILMKEAQTLSTGVCAPTPKDSPVTTVTDHLACAGTSPKGAPQPNSCGTALTQHSHPWY